MDKKTFSIGDAISFGWQTLKENLGFLVLVTLIMGLASALFQGPQSAFSFYHSYGGYVAMMIFALLGIAVSMFITIAANYGLWQSSWMLQYPPNCTNCDHDFRMVIPTVTTAEPMTRVGLLTYDNDTTIKLFFGYGLFDSIVAQVSSLIATFYTLPTTHVYEVVGADHTMLGSVNSNVALGTWVRQWASGDAAWANSP